ncbi:MAG TPA: alanine racemase C-terminal domain-containing protein, partial [Candidatus Melainabacteria bacterium]|nr:alanine racemase C-terminal domain-containing protein [Candidatus Melainabacteria bacterium]
SEAAEKFSYTHHDLVRIGIFLYGLRPRGASLDLHPALSVRGRIMSIVEVPEGESAGYNWTWTASRNSRLASIPIGYADGVSRKLSNNIYGYLMGKKIPQAGLISMDQMLFDITDLPEAREGDVITLIGSDERAPQSPLALAGWAQQLDTITYELACRLRVRLPRIYFRGAK